ncbi:hypothetical protein PG661_10835, partial [Riemerella anatipestifer]|nr:hypothetical protein [Riemerella anatipestifer]
MKKYFYILLLFILANPVFGQNKELRAFGYESFQVVYNSLQLYSLKTDGLYQDNYDIHGDILYNHSSEKIEKISDYGNFPAIKIDELDSNFDLIKELNEKVYSIERNRSRHFIYLKNDSIVVYKRIDRKNIWTITKEREDKIYKINLGHNKYIYWSYYLGLIFKKAGEIETQFLDLMYYYKDQSNKTIIVDKKNANMDAGYFEYNNFIVKPNKRSDYTVEDTKQDNTYSVYKNDIKILDNVSLRYYNDKQLIAINKDSIIVYNADFNIKNSYKYRDLTETYDYIEFLTKNEINHLSIKDYTTTFEINRALGCGNVTRYTLQIEGKSIVEEIDGRMNGGYTSKNKVEIISPKKFDELTFISGHKSMSWSVNGGFD